MIAITGSNGGCGKTTTTLGLARALAGPDSPVLAVDADRQLPDLHVTAGVERTPTVAAVADADDPAALAQPVPEAPGVAVLPGPTPEESLDVGAALSTLESVDGTVLVDCPSGMGPDLTDPLTAADRTVVVAADDARPSDLRTTLDIARRLDVPVAGVVVTEADTVPGPVEAAVDVPVLATVPPSASPLADEATLAAYERAGAALAGPADPTEATTGTAPNRVPTGVDPLDRVLGGGVPGGSVVALVADPSSHAERILHRLPAIRGTLYVSTDRPAPLVSDAVAADPGSRARPTVRAVGPDDPLAETTDLLADLPAGATLVVDAADALEAASRGDYATFLEALAVRMAETGGVAVLHCPDRGAPSSNRALTQRVADVVVVVEAVATGRRVDQRVRVTKCRPDPSATGVASLSVEGETDLGADAAAEQ